MRLGSRAKLTIAVGVTAAAGFIILGLRDLASPGRESPLAGPLINRSASENGAQPALLAATARAVRTGETITADMIRSAALDPALHPTIAGPIEAIGSVAMRDIPANALVPRGALNHEAKLAIRVPLGMRAISIDTTAEIAVAGLLRPGDRVDVQVVYPGADAIAGARGMGRSQAQTLLQMVSVLAVGDTVLGASPANGRNGADERADGESRSSAPAPAVARTVTLALFPEQVSILSLAKSTGALHLSLRNPGDAAQPQVARASSAGPLPELARAAPLPSYPAPAPARAPMPVTSSARPPAGPQHHPIDLVVGGRHRVIYSGSEAR
jgi:pilus assembly protein CpaB